MMIPMVKTSCEDPRQATLGVLIAILSHLQDNTSPWHIHSIWQVGKLRSSQHGVPAHTIKVYSPCSRQAVSACLCPTGAWFHLSSENRH